MAKRGKNSKEHILFKKQFYAAKSFILDSAFDDDCLSEKANVLTPNEIERHLEIVFAGEGIYKGAVPSYGEDGTVLVDSRGRGAIQIGQQGTE